MQEFVKWDRHGQASLEGEAAALRWLAAAEPEGGLHAAKVIFASPEQLVEECVRTCSPTVSMARNTGAALAHTHASGASWWGCPPPGWSGSYRINHSLTPTVEEKDAPSTWGSFYAEYRVMSYVRYLRDAGEYGSHEVSLFESLSSRLVAGVYDSPQPELVRKRGYEVARLHGDLWAGNLLWDANPNNLTSATLIDPMACGGHAETDLAMLALFGCSHLHELLRGYEEVSQLADGWKERVALHQLAPLLLHCVLFGGYYLDSALRVVRQYL